MKTEPICVSVLYLLSICVFISLSLFPLPASATTPENISYPITVSVSIGEPKLTLFGYCSPHAEVKLEGELVFEQTTANEQGYFFFDRIFLPASTRSRSSTRGGPLSAYPELCLTAIDTQDRISFPTCLPPLPTGPFEITVGPVLLPPTISLGKGNFLPTEQVAAEGETIPDTEVTIYLANDFLTAQSASTILGDRFLWLKLKGLKNLLASPIYAYSLPKYKIQANEKGRFEFNLPGVRPTSWRLFAATTYLGSPTPKSNTLTFKVLGWWEWLWQKLKEILMWVFTFIKPHLLTIILFIEVVILGFTLIYWRNLRGYD